MALKIGKLKHRPGLVLTGPFAGRDPFSQFNRNLALALQQQGHFELGLLADDLPGLLSEPSLQALFERLPKQLSAQIEHRALPVLIAPDKGHWVVMQPWEYGALPQNWLPLLHEMADQVWVHSLSNYQACLNAGLTPERLKLLPPGVNPEHFQLQGPQLELPNTRPFRFLFMAEALWYSGLDLLLQAFDQEFLPDEPVSLVIQDLSAADSSARQEMLAQIKALQSRENAPSVLLLDRQISDAERAALYRSCDVLVSPCRADAFETQLLEAAACGLPLIVSELDGGLHLPEHPQVHRLSGRSLRHVEQQIGGLPTDQPPYWFEPNLQELRYQLRLAFEQSSQTPPEQAAALSQQILNEFSWSQSAQKAQQLLSELATKPLFRQAQAELQRQALQGLQALEAGEFAQALSHLEQVKAEMPDNPWVLLDLAGTHLQQGTYAEALPYLYQGLKLAPEHANFYHAAGIALYHQQAWQLAARCFEQVLALEPQHKGALESLPPATQQAGHADDRSDEFADWQTLLTHFLKQRRPTLGLSMIVKDEETHLPLCLASVAGMVDEVVVVDTGSSDRSREVAQEAGARVVDFPWNGSFSDARNAGLNEMQSDWVLVLDADEVMDPDTVHNLRGLIEMSTAQLTGYQLKIRNYKYADNDVDVVEHYMLRLFPNHPGLRFQGVIHEQLNAIDPKLDFVKLAVSDLLILHSGYTEDMMETRNKFERNLKLVQQALKQEPHNPFHWFNLGLTYRSNDQDREALKAFQTAVEKSQQLEKFPLYMAACYSYIMSLQLALGETDAALETARQAPEECQDSPDYWLNYGSIWNQHQEPEKALAAFEKALALRRNPSLAIVSDRAATTWKPLVGIGNTYLLQNDLTQADFYFRRALRENPGQSDILLGLLRLSLLRQLPTEAQSYLNALRQRKLTALQQVQTEIETARLEVLEKQDTSAQARLEQLLAGQWPDHLQTAIQSELSQIYLRQGKLQQAQALMGALTQSRQLFDQTARYFYQQGAFDQLLALLNAMIEEADSPQAQDYLHRGIVYLQLEQLQAAETDLKRALQLAPENAEVLHHLGVWALQSDLLEQAQPYFEAALQHNPEFLASHLDLAKLALHHQDLKAAKSHLLKAQQLKPDQLEVLATLAYVQYALEQPEAAAASYMDILELDPLNSEARVQLGYLLNELGEPRRALQLYDQALELGNQSVSLYNGIGLAFLATGQYLEARNAFLLALQQDPEQPELQRAVQMADQLCGQAPLEASS